MNIIELVLDCASYNRIENTTEHASPMPYLMSMKKKGIWCTKCYSQGPYTESALMGLTFGKDTLDENGYFASFFDWDKSIYHQFKNSGYDVFVTYSYSVMPKEVKTSCDYTDSSNYGAPYFSRFIRGRLDYYLPIFKKGELTLDDKVIIADFLSNVFEVMIGYYSPASLEHDYTRCAFNKRNKEQLDRIEAWRSQLQREKKVFDENPLDYIDKIFNDYEKHFIVCNCDLFPSSVKENVKENRDWIKNNKKLFGKLYRTKMKEYLITNRPDIKQSAHFFKMLFTKDARNKGQEYFKRLIKAAFFYNKSKMYDNSVKQLLPCARNDIDSLLGWIKNRNSKAPFYAYIHVDDYHGESVLCSYDLDDRDVIEQELKDADNYAKERTKKDKGDIVKDLSLRYLDSCIEHLFTELKSLGRIEDTVVVITADHGSSNAGGPFRYTNTNNFYDEQYHTVLYIYGLDKERIIDSYINGKDIARTLLETAEVNFTENFNGTNFLSENSIKRDHTYIEYMGTGMPDLARRPIYFEFRNKSISCVFSIYLLEGINSLKLLEYYDLDTDPKEYRNIADVHEKDKVSLFNCFESRLDELKSNYLNYLNMLHGKYIGKMMQN